MVRGGELRCRSCRTRDMPPANRACRCVALRFFRALCHGIGIRRVCDPQGLGVALALRLQVGVLRQGASKLAVSYTRAFFANLIAEIIARAPPNKRSAVWGAATQRSKVSIAACRDAYLSKQERGACHAYCTTCNEAPCRETPTSNRSVSFPLSREASDGGAKTRRLTFANARRLNESNPVHNGRRVLGGTCALRFLSLYPGPVNDIDIIILANQTN
jgi:hypothetical protein